MRSKQAARIRQGVELNRRLQLIALQVVILAFGFAVGFQWWSAPVCIAITVVMICLPAEPRKAAD